MIYLDVIPDTTNIRFYYSELNLNRKEKEYYNLKLNFFQINKSGIFVGDMNFHIKRNDTHYDEIINNFELIHNHVVKVKYLFNINMATQYTDSQNMSFFSINLKKYVRDVKIEKILCF